MIGVLRVCFMVDHANVGAAAFGRDSSMYKDLTKLLLGLAAVLALATVGICSLARCGSLGTGAPEYNHFFLAEGATVGLQTAVTLLALVLLLLDFADVLLWFDWWDKTRLILTSIIGVATVGYFYYITFHGLQSVLLH